MTTLRIGKKLIVLIVMMKMIVIFWQNPDKWWLPPAAVGGWEKRLWMNAMIIVIMIRMITIITIIMIMRIISEETIFKRMSEEIGGMAIHGNTMAIQWQYMAIHGNRKETSRTNNETTSRGIQYFAPYCKIKIRNNDINKTRSRGIHYYSYSSQNTKQCFQISSWDYHLMVSKRCRGVSSHEMVCLLISSNSPHHGWMTSTSPPLAHHRHTFHF